MLHQGIRGLCEAVDPPYSEGLQVEVGRIGKGVRPIDIGCNIRTGSVLSDGHWRMASGGRFLGLRDGGMPDVVPEQGVGSDCVHVQGAK
jgi:hypothetical protein